MRAEFGAKLAGQGLLCSPFCHIPRPARPHQGTHHPTRSTRPPPRDPDGPWFHVPRSPHPILKLLPQSLSWVSTSHFSVKVAEGGAGCALGVALTLEAAGERSRAGGALRGGGDPPRLHGGSVPNSPSPRPRSRSTPILVSPLFHLAIFSASQPRV